MTNLLPTTRSLYAIALSYPPFNSRPSQFPVEGSPRIFPLMTSANTVLDPVTGQRRVTRTPHPELYMSLSHNSGWVCQRIDSLYGMNRSLSNP